MAYASDHSPGLIPYEHTSENTYNVPSTGVPKIVVMSHLLRLAMLSNTIRVNT